MRIQLLLPFVVDGETRKYLSGFVPPEIDIVGLKKGRISETRADLAFTLSEELEAITKAEKDGYDAVVIGDAGDTNAELAREIVKIPVLSCYQATLHLGSVLGNRLCILVPSGRYGIRMQRQNAKHYGFENVSFRAITFNVQQSLLQADQYKKTGKINEAIELLTNEAIRAIEDHDADVLALGCNGLAWAVPPRQG